MTITNAHGFIPVEISAPIGPGSVQGAMAPKPIENILMNAHDVNTNVSGASINGIINVPFNTIGNPNITGSFILNIPGTSDDFEIAFACLDLPIINVAITNPNVAPAPPIHTNHCKNGSGNVWGTSAYDPPPDTNVPFSSIAFCQNGLTTEPIILVPWIPNDQKNVTNNTISITPNIPPVNKFCIGANAIDKKFVKSKFNRYLNEPNNIAVNNIGEITKNESEIAFGTALGILIVSLNLMQKCWISTAIMDAIIDVNTVAPANVLPIGAVKSNHSKYANTPSIADNKELKLYDFPNSDAIPKAAYKPIVPIDK